MSSEPVLLTITKLGSAGDGLAQHEGAQIAVPYVLPGERVRVVREGGRAHVLELVTASAERIAPVCKVFGDCGGCALQMMLPDAVLAWKRTLVVDALRAQKLGALDGLVRATLPAYGTGRRRVTFHARVVEDGRGMRFVTGLMKARSHDLVELNACPILAPALQDAPRLAQAIADCLSARVLHKPASKKTMLQSFDLLMTATESGVDVDLRGLGTLEPTTRQALIACAQTLNLARLSNHGDVLIEQRPPLVTMGDIAVVLPPGCFLQPTQAGEDLLAKLVHDALAHNKLSKGATLADLFCGVGTFALRLASRYHVEVYDSDAAMITSLTKAAKHGQGGTVQGHVRDLFARPLLPQELAACDALILDPPRAGAKAQCEVLVEAHVPLVVYVSCDVQSFARDAKILIEGGYHCQSIQPVDQFIYAPHIECVSVFVKPRVKKNPRKPIL